jgi:hypothetical protein
MPSVGNKTSTAVGKKNVTASTIFMKRLRAYETIIIIKKIQLSPNSSHVTTMVQHGGWLKTSERTKATSKGTTV